MARQQKFPFKLDKYTWLYYQKRLRWFLAGFLLGILFFVTVSMIFFAFNKQHVCSWFRCQTTPAVIQPIVEVGCNDQTEQQGVIKPEQLSQQELELMQATDNADQAQAADNYQIKAGDNLWKIAEEQLGDGYRWIEIYQLNRGMIGDNPDLIYPQVVLTLPSS